MGRFDIELRNEVADFPIVAKRLEAVREAPWNMKLSTISVRQFGCLPGQPVCSCRIALEPSA